MSVLLDFSDVHMAGDELCFTPKNRQMALQFVLTHDKDKTYTCEIKEYRKKRSRTANDFAWVLIDKLADATGTTKEEVYRREIKDAGVFRDFHLPEKEASSMESAWALLGTGWVTERVDFSGGMVTIRAYYGSSRYNTKQMARLIDAIVQDCEAVGIDASTPKERALLLDEWGKK